MVTEPTPATAANQARIAKRRCACRPGCLTWLHPADNTAETAAGAALTAHLQVDPYPDARVDDDLVDCSGWAS